MTGEPSPVPADWTGIGPDPDRDGNIVVSLTIAGVPFAASFHSRDIELLARCINDGVVGCRAPPEKHALSGLPGSA